MHDVARQIAALERKSTRFLDALCRVVEATGADPDGLLDESVIDMAVVRSGRVVTDRDAALLELRALEWILYTGRQPRIGSDGRRSIANYVEGSGICWTTDSWSSIATSLGWTDPLTPPAPHGSSLRDATDGQSTAAEAAEGKES